MVTLDELAQRMWSIREVKKKSEKVKNLINKWTNKGDSLYGKKGWAVNSVV